MNRIVERARDDTARHAETWETRLLDAYTKVCDEFTEFTRYSRERVPNYNAAYKRFVDELDRAMGLSRKPIYVKFHLYSKDVWGPLYWRFFHYASIVLSLAMKRNLLPDPRDFPLLLYNVDAILPCPECIEHYRAIKNSDRIQIIVKNMSYGYVIAATMEFHNAITRNVTQYYPNPSSVSYFGSFHFAETYGCYEPIEASERTFTNVYARPGPVPIGPILPKLVLLLSYRTKTQYVLLIDNAVKAIASNDELAIRGIVPLLAEAIRFQNVDSAYTDNEQGDFRKTWLELCVEFSDEFLEILDESDAERDFSAAYPKTRMLELARTAISSRNSEEKLEK